MSTKTSMSPAEERDSRARQPRKHCTIFAYHRSRRLTADEDTTKFLHSTTTPKTSRKTRVRKPAPTTKKVFKHTRVSKINTVYSHSIKVNQAALPQAQPPTPPVTPPAALKISPKAGDDNHSPDLSLPKLCLSLRVKTDVERQMAPERHTSKVEARKTEVKAPQEALPDFETDDGSGYEGGDEDMYPRVEPKPKRFLKRKIQRKKDWKYEDGMEMGLGLDSDPKCYENFSDSGDDDYWMDDVEDVEV
ncbi:hypothetical protein RRF57_005754 [Xylaria bambusicola]|uniref:Uncharacterized protein n=1 Tax=Xylaria bambusicola TaxID=326684 RepID=A0AAN7UMP1_9PEZI